MTIIEAIKEVLKSEPKGLSSAEIYQRIIDQNLYQFGAKNPAGVVNTMNPIITGVMNRVERICAFCSSGTPCKVMNDWIKYITLVITANTI